MNYLLHHKVYRLLLILFLQVNAIAHAQDPSFVQLNNGEPEFTVEAGEQQDITLTFQIKGGYHVQAYQVKEENLIPTVLTFDAPDHVSLGDPVFPEAVEFRMKGEEEPWHVYSDKLEINVPVRIKKAVEKGELSINGKLHYQACDNFKCYFPRDLNFIMKLNIQ